MWVTRTGRTLSPEGGAYWERLYRTGHTDGLGHMRAPSVVQQPPKPVYDLTHVAKAQPLAQPKKPSFDTAVKAMHGDRAAQAELARWGKHKRGEREGALSAQQARDVGLFGAALPAVQSAYPVVNPVAGAIIQSLGAIIQSLSPTTAAVDALHAARRGAIPEAGVAALGLLPFPIGKGARAAKAAVDAEEAARAAETVAKAATPEGQVLGALKGSKQAYAEQKALRSEELGKRAQSAGHAAELAGGGQEGVKAALGELKGALPHVRFDELTHLTETEVKTLIDAVDAHPGLEFFENLGAKVALLNAAEGKVIRPFEARLIERVFGPDAAAEAERATPLSHGAMRVGGEILNIPRSLMASLDVSGVFRQALVMTAHNPKLVAKTLGPMFHALASEKYYRQLMQQIVEMPTYERMQKAGVSLTELGDMSKREEQVMSNYAEKITGGKFSFVRASGRAYTGLLNTLRAQEFDGLVKNLADEYAARGISEAQMDREIGRFVNWATGRGHLGGLEPAAVPLNTLLFSPRLFASRIETINPFFYKGMSPPLRKKAVLATAKLVSAGTSILALAALAGARVGQDPRSADFGKIRVGNTRFDIWGGHQQLARVFSQIAAGSVVSSATGKTTKLGPGFGESSKFDVGMRFLQGKLAPGPSVIADWARQADFAHRPFSWKREVVSKAWPLILQDAWDIYHGTGNPALALGGYGVGALGIGVQTYGPPKPKATGRGRPRGRGRSYYQSGSAPATTGSQGGGTSYYTP